MKKLNLLMLIALFGFFSCSEEEIMPTIEDVLGNWQTVNLEYSGKSTTTYLGQSYSVPFNGVGENIDVGFVFNESPQNFTVSGSYDIELTYDMMGQTVTESFQDLPFVVPGGDWSLNGKDLTLTAAGIDPQIAKIISFDAENLVIQVTQVTMISESGVEVKYETVLTFSLKRL